MSEYHFVCDGPPSHESGRFVEPENERGQSINPGRWERIGNYWHLIVPAPAAPTAASVAQTRKTSYHWWCPKCAREADWREDTNEVLMKAGLAAHAPCGTWLELRAGSSTIPTAAPEGIPVKQVAWRLRIGDSNIWSYCELESDADLYGGASGRKYEKQPLYVVHIESPERIHTHFSGCWRYHLECAVSYAERLTTALEIISGTRQCVDGLLSDKEIARIALKEEKPACPTCGYPDGRHHMHCK